jgi:hypothetical protein
MQDSVGLFLNHFDTRFYRRESGLRTAPFFYIRKAKVDTYRVPSGISEAR